ncbi:LysR family transcriptional regulator [Bacillus sp. AFS017336]|uniref:LysR family transcriptional regulator n=1 Tax=Bacillus sp. AFS017336 TaxID=2033489 RepID=UPI000BEFF286|nr:LysR family transcriptional regulator [Bacillus sp. AFS017336]PEL09932.1 hypothetical protein CN601_15450 [Bacillus sp. AFS017336]
MHLEKLEILVEVAKTGSISIAAENLHVSQSGISQAITKIEEELGIKIFNRSRLGASLTVDGAKIVGKSQEILLKYTEIKAIAQKSLDTQISELRVSMVPAFVNYLLTPLVEFKDQHLNLHIDILESTTERTIEIVKKNQVDIGIICFYEGITKELEEFNCEELIDGKMKAYVKKDSPFAISKKITPEELLQQKFVLYNGDYIRWFTHNFQRNIGELTILFSSNHTEELLRAILNGSAITWGPNFSIKNHPYILNGELVEVDIINYEHVNSTLGVITSKKKILSKVEKQFINFLRSEITSY